MNFFRSLNLNTANIAYMVVGIFLMLGIMSFSVLKLTAPMMAPLYSDLSIEDSSMIMSKLQSMGIPYESSADGKQLMVPSSSVFQLRMSFAQDGIPHSGNIVGYEIFDKADSFGTSQFTYSVNYIRALEGELARTIGGMQTIDSARVHVVIPKRELFSQPTTSPSASVIIKPKGNKMLGKNEISAISYLVANAVPGLEAAKVAIVDNLGRPLKIGNGEEDDAVVLSSNAAEYQSGIESKFAREITQLLERSVGIGKVKVSVSAVIDFDREVVNTESFDPTSQVLRSKKITEESDKSSAGGEAVSISTNVEDSSGSGSGPTRAKERTDAVENYEITRTVSNKIIEGGHIKRLSIAIILDGTYDIDDSGNVNYKPRADEEIAKLKSLVVSAVALDKDRGDQVEIVNMKFAPDFADLPKKTTFMDWIRDDLQNVVQTVVIGLVLILVIVLIIRPVAIKSVEMIKERQEYERTIQEAAEAQKVQEESEKERQSDEKHVYANEEARKIGLTQRLDDIAAQNPDEMVSFIRNWLYQE